MTATSEAAPGRHELRALTGLRSIAAGAVFAVHAPFAVSRTVIAPVLPYAIGVGRTGVALFFVLSGFLLAQPGTMRGGLRGYGLRRVARVYPTYLVTSVLMAALLTLQDPADVPRVGRVVLNLLLLQSWGPGGSGESVDLPAWSLSVEALFYALLPLLVPWVARASRRSPWGTFLALVAYAVAAELLWRQGAVTAAFPPLYLAVFLAGVHVAQLEVRVRLRWVLVAVGVGLVASVTVELRAHQVDVPGLNLMAWPFALLVLALARSDRARLLTGRLTHRLGLWSYSFFLVQVPVIFVINGVLTTPPSNLLVGVAILIVTAAACWASAAVLYHLVEEPVRTLLVRRASLLPGRVGAAGLDNAIPRVQ